MIETDLLVVGSGAAGFAATLSAAHQPRGQVGGDAQVLQKAICRPWARGHFTP